MNLKEDILKSEELLLSLRERIAALQKESARVEKAIASKKELFQKPSVSDHALLRFLERHLEINLDAARNSLLTQDVLDAMLAGCKSIKKDGLEIKIQGNTITTIY